MYQGVYVKANGIKVLHMLQKISHLSTAGRKLEKPEDLLNQVGMMTIFMAWFGAVVMIFLKEIDLLGPPIQIKVEQKVDEKGIVMKEEDKTTNMME